MRPAVELRVHGVGGSSGARILGLGSEEEPELVTFGDRTEFWRRPGQPEVQGYVWGGLTSGSILQPFWILLLPFTLVNVAGWMHEPVKPSGTDHRVRWTRRLAFLLGLSLTMTYVLWIFVMLEESFGAQWFAQHTRDLRWQWWIVDIGHTTPRYGVGLGAVGVLIVLALLALLAKSARSGERQTESVMTVSASSSRGGPVGVAKEESLRDLGFFNRAKDSGQLLVIHLLVCCGAVIMLTLRAWDAAVGGRRRPAPFVGTSFRALLLAQLVLLLLLFLVSVRRETKGFRWAGPAIAGVLAIVFANAILAGSSRLFDSLLGVNVGTKFQYADVTVASLLFMLIVFGIWSGVYGFFPTRMSLADDVPANTAPPGFAANGVVPSDRKTTARFRGLTNGVTKTDIPLTLSAGFALVLAATAGYLRRDDPDRFRSELLSVAGTKVIAAVGALLILLLWKGRTNRSLQKTVGIVWDLLTFWPRRFHPFAVRPYSEQAVQELRGRILALSIEHAADNPHLVLTAHSQGTVLSFAAIAPLVTPPHAVPISYVTFGSHLGGLFRVFFPAYFSPEVMTEVHYGLLNWHNFRRLTDPIGSDIESVVTTWLDSPGVTPSPGPPLVVEQLPAERDRPPWFKVETHSHYRNEPVLKRTVDELRRS